ncbi:hypothetical protein NQ314_007009 [Rhamnusium bicolor]|uniref:YLP motif-containing protein 1 n=1 Tax=Rhamnusium bicolor TaxID=1586634 RepID=A0AAV8YVN0_9CUCU|nr:hypothetical protein NQ314_007009 [Rhamnusium bicolor]
MDQPPPGMRMDQPPPGRRMDQPPPGRRMDQPPPGRRMDQPPPLMGIETSPVIIEPPRVITPEPPAVEEEIFEPTTVIDYDHKSLKPAEPDVVVEPIQMFDYRHKPLNRIPVPQRPRWLVESVKFIREFDPLASRPTLNFERPPPLDRYIRRDEWRSDNPDDRYVPRNRNFDERDRRYLNDYDGHTRIERKPFNRDERDRDEPRFDRDRDEPRFERDRDEPRFERDRDESRFERDSNEGDDRNRRRFNENDRFGRKRNEDTSRSEPRRNTRGRNDFEELSDDDMDFESGELQKHQQNRGERSASRSPILSNPPNPATNFGERAMIEDIINPPGRFNRAPRIVIILRGPPGSGKTFLAKLIKDKEVENGGSAPRILSLDDYFMVEHEKEVNEDGKMIKVKEMVYEYEAEMEESYRNSFEILQENYNRRYAKQNGFQVYVCQMDLDPVLCTKRNIHNRSEAEIEECIAGWEPTPNHHPTVDASGLIQSSSAISDVEMEEVEQQPEEVNPEKEPEDEVRSKWDTFDCSSNNLAKLDGVSKPLRPSRTMEEYLQLEDEWEPTKPTKPGQKRVRWADLEEQREQKKMRAIGFIVGHTNWDRMMDPTDGSSALTRTKYIDKVKHY